MRKKTLVRGAVQGKFDAAPSQICDILPWKVCTFVSPSGANQVQKAVDGLSSVACETFKTELRHLAQSPREEWRQPHAKQLKGYQNLVEVIFKADRVQLRAVGFFGPLLGQFTITVLCTHKQNVYSPRDALDTAAKRKREVEVGEAGTAPLQVYGENFPPLSE